MRLTVCVDSVVLREAVGGGNSLRDRGRLEGGAFLPDGLQERRGVCLFQVSAVEMYEVVLISCALLCLSYQP